LQAKAPALAVVILGVLWVLFRSSEKRKDARITVGSPRTTGRSPRSPRSAGGQSPKLALSGSLRSRRRPLHEQVMEAFSSALLSVTELVQPRKNAVADAAPTTAAEAAPEDDNKVFIYYGSQTGTAESYAKDIEDECKQRGVAVEVLDLETFSDEAFSQHKNVIMVVATYGEGEPTDNSRAFHDWIIKESSPDCLKGMNFTVMGLGNTQYAQFNAMGALCEEKMQTLGAKLFYERGIGDDNDDIDRDFEQWKSKGPLIDKICDLVGAGAGETQAAGGIPDAKAVVEKLPLVIDFHDHAQDAVMATEDAVADGGSTTLEKVFFALQPVVVSTVRELRQAPCQDQGLLTAHVDLDLSGSSLAYCTADNADLLPENDPELVQWFAQALDAGSYLDRHMSFSTNEGVDSGKKPWAPCTVRDALVRYLDLTQLPGKKVLMQLGAFVPSPEAREVLEKLLEDADALKGLHSAEFQMSFREFWLIYFSGIEIDLSAFLQICPRQKIRPYTISSSSKATPKTISITCSMVVTPLDKTIALAARLTELEGKGLAPAGAAAKLEGSRKYFGVASGYLTKRLAVGQTVLTKVATSSFRLPEDASKPVIMVSAGTGIAPMRAFLQEFKHLKRGGEAGKSVLFFGCTHKERDFIYEDEIEEALKMGHLSQFVPAFSRMQDHKIYVQDRVREHGAAVKELLTSGGLLYICGATAMGNAVFSVLGELGLDVTQLRKDHVIIEELWG